ncbi:MAG: MoaD/ThiS family protein [Gammaproteobacteria bacterium]|nr:MoaD/ThiS family protein [Gammaproteobacteria bacterium]
MRVKLKLFASLRPLLPAAEKGELVVEVDDGATPETLIQRFALPREQVHLILVNGFYVAPDAAGTRPLAEGDEVALWPPVAGG